MSKNYDVGYRRPPKGKQFKKGESGNPKGRPKGTKNFKTDLEEEFQDLILVREGGTRKTITKQRAMITTMMNKAIKGDTKTAWALFNMLTKLGGNTQEVGEVVDLDEEDKKILQQFLEESVQELKFKEDKS